MIESYGRYISYEQHMNSLHHQQKRDEALLRQALEALEDDRMVQVGPHAWDRRSDLAIAALRERLGTQSPADIADRLARHGIPMPGDTT